jgi:hypothetical protein
MQTQTAYQGDLGAVRRPQPFSPDSAPSAPSAPPEYDYAGRLAQLEEQNRDLQRQLQQGNRASVAARRLDSDGDEVCCTTRQAKRCAKITCCTVVAMHLLSGAVYLGGMAAIFYFASRR